MSDPSSTNNNQLLPNDNISGVKIKIYLFNIQRLVRLKFGLYMQSQQKMAYLDAISRGELSKRLPHSYPLRGYYEELSG